MSSTGGDLGQRTAALFAVAAGTLNDTRHDVSECQRHFDEGVIDNERLAWLSSHEYAKQLYTSMALAEEDVYSEYSGFWPSTSCKNETFEEQGKVHLMVLNFS